MTKFNQSIIDKVFLVFTVMFSAFCIGLSAVVFSLWNGYMILVGLIGIVSSGYLWLYSFNYYGEYCNGKE